MSHQSNNLSKNIAALCNFLFMCVFLSHSRGSPAMLCGMLVFLLFVDFIFMLFCQCDCLTVVCGYLSVYTDTLCHTVYSSVLKQSIISTFSKKFSAA